MTPTKTPTYPSNNHVEGLANQVASRAADFGSDAFAAVSNTSTQAGKQLQQVAGQSEKFAKQYPWVAAGAMLGLGALIGVVAQRLLGHRPGVTELLGIDALPAKAKRALSRYL